MADIEAEAKKLVNSLKCFQAVCMTQASFDYENHDIAAVAEFCRKLVGDKDNEIAELNIHRDGFRQTIRELEQENRNHELTISSYQVVERELNDQLLQYSNILAAERASREKVTEEIIEIVSQDNCKSEQYDTCARCTIQAIREAESERKVNSILAPTVEDNLVPYQCEHCLQVIDADKYDDHMKAERERDDQEKLDDSSL